MKTLREVFKRWSIQKRWTFATTLTIFTTYTIICSITLYAIHLWLIHSEEFNANRTVDDIEAYFSQADGTLTIQQLQRDTALMNAIVNQNQTIRIFNADNIEVVRINNVTKAVPNPYSINNLESRKLVRTSVESTKVMVIYEQVRLGAFVGYMQLIHPLTNYESIMQYIMTTMSILGLGALLLAFVISNVIAKQLLKPIEQLQLAMDKVGESGANSYTPIKYGADDEIKKLLVSYEGMIKQLDRSFQQQQQFVSAASHELRTPVQVIEGHLSLVQRWGKDNPEVLDEAINTALSETKKMKQLMEVLLQLTKNDPISFDQGIFAEEIIELVAADLRFLMGDFKLNVHVEGEPKPLKTSRQVLGQIFRNIMENSIRYSLDVIQLEVTVHYHSVKCFVEFKDSGIGIAKEHLPYIFERFYRVDESRTKVDGAGLGLSITKMLANQYHIQIDVQSELNVGTIFLLQIPLSSTGLTEE